jgi:hypothetical protein
MKSLATRRYIAKENNMGSTVFVGAFLGVLIGAAVVYFNLGII